MTEAHIVDAVRTPRGIGKMGNGALSHIRPEHLAAAVLSAIKDLNDLDTADADDVIWGVSGRELSSAQAGVRDMCRRRHGPCYHHRTCLVGTEGGQQRGR